jgi:hypothetical protein
VGWNFSWWPYVFDPFLIESINTIFGQLNILYRLCNWK